MFAPQQFQSENTNDDDDETITLPLDQEIRSLPLTQKFIHTRNQTLSKLRREVTLVVIGAYHSERNSTEYSRFLLACLNESCGRFETVCALSVGLNDQDKEEISRKLKNLIIPKAKENYKYNFIQPPQVWFDPITVWEIKAADISLSSLYKAAFEKYKPGMGFVLRFPRFIKERPFKKPQDITTVSDIIWWYQENAQLF